MDEEKKNLQINAKEQEKQNHLFVVELELCLSYKIKEPMSFNTQHILNEANVPKQKRITNASTNAIFLFIKRNALIQLNELKG